MSVDKIIKNGKILSFDLEGRKTEYEAVSIKENKIVTAGNTEDIIKSASGETEVIDAMGNTVLAGMCDSHLHVSSVAEDLFSINIYYIEPEEGENRVSYIHRLLEKVKKYADENPQAPVIRATGWNPAAFTAMGAMPTCEEIDWVSVDRPVLLKSYCHHFIWINSKAMEMSGITKDTPLGQGCIVEKDKEGNPSGTFIDVPACSMITESFDLADFSVEEYKVGILQYQNKYGLENGITAVFDAFVTPHIISAYKELAENGELKMRVRGAFLADPTKDISQFDEMIAAKEKFNVGDMFRIDTVKFFFDGGEFTALMNKPLNPEILKANGYPEDYLGPYIWYPEQAKEAFKKIAGAGFQIHIHCIGDGAAKEAVDCFEYLDGLGLNKYRNTITHIMNIDESDIDRMAKYKVIASMQAQWASPDKFHENYVTPLLGDDRAQSVYPVGELIRRGVRVSAATDFPIETIYNSMGNIQIGITRKVPKAHFDYQTCRDKILGPTDNPRKYCATLDQMLAAYTVNGAYQLFLEDMAGSIEAGKSADFVILDNDIEAVDTMDIENIRVNRVIFKGDTVYTR